MATPRKTSVFGLAVADLIHERVLALCMILALAAILSPLLIVLGLKEGVITNLRNDLIEDPVNREIRPTQTQNLPQSWFDEMGAREDVAFMVPGILRGASIVRLRDPESGRSEAIDLLPTGAGDPLLLGNGATPPEPGQAAVSKPLAEAYDLEAGSPLRIEVTRTINNRPEVREVDLEVSGVLGIRGDALKRVYAPLGLVVDVESYKEGFAVPERGWSGQQPEPVPVYDAAIIALPNELSALQRSSLTVATGFSRMEDLAPGEFEALYGFPAPDGFDDLIKLTTIEATVTSSSFRQIANELRGRGALILPVVEPIGMIVDGEPLEVTGYTVTASQAERFDLMTPPWARLSGDAAFRDQARLLRPASSKPGDAPAEPGDEAGGAREDPGDAGAAQARDGDRAAGEGQDGDGAGPATAPSRDTDAPEPATGTPPAAAEADGPGEAGAGASSTDAGTPDEDGLAAGADAPPQPGQPATDAAEPGSDSAPDGGDDASVGSDDGSAPDEARDRAAGQADTSRATRDPSPSEDGARDGPAPPGDQADADAPGVSSDPEAPGDDGSAVSDAVGQPVAGAPGGDETGAAPPPADEADAGAPVPDAAPDPGAVASLYDTPSEVTASSPGKDGVPVTFPLDIIGEAPGQRALVPLEMAARLRAIQERGARYDPGARTLLLDRAGYRGFRLYARSIDDVPELVSAIEAREIPVTAKVSEIVGLQRFSSGLDRIFILVASVGAIGGMASLVASLYAAVERKKREISVMRLLGLSPGGVFRFPVYQGVLLGLGAIALSYGLYRLVGSAINAVLAQEMTGPAVWLAGWLLALVGAGVVVVAMLSALVAAMRATRIEPADALRVE